MIFKKNFFCITVEPSYEHKGGRFRMMDEPSYGRERVKLKRGDGVVAHHSINQLYPLELSLTHNLHF